MAGIPRIRKLSAFSPFSKEALSSVVEDKPQGNVSVLLRRSLSYLGDMEKLIEHISSTKKSRFNAGRRMHGSHIASLVFISFSSLLIICINIFDILPSPEAPSADGIRIPFALMYYRSVASVISIVLSAFVLVMSVIVFGFNYSIKSENFHACGVELTELQDKARILNNKRSGNPTDSEIDSIRIEYHDILRRHNLNHKVIDHLYAEAYDEKTATEETKKAKKYSDFDNWRIRWWWHLSNDSTVYWTFLVLAFSAVAGLLCWRMSLMY